MEGERLDRQRERERGRKSLIGLKREETYNKGKKP